jgi:phosphoribosylaminoimidazolecarboxamide formyltransferase/IMP cyclohydrolase
MSRLALLSVSDKTGVVELGRGLVDLGFEILSTGGTAKALAAGGVPVIKVSDHTGAPEVFNGRVKSLHPAIHGGILGRRGQDDAEAAANGIRWIDLVACNLYPFEQTVSGGASLADAVENIDIGGPSMVRSAAKNHAHVAVVVDPSDYSAVLRSLADGTLDAAARGRLAVKAFRHTAAYDALISSWLAEAHGVADMAEGAIPLRRVQSLRYGENPHQAAVFYAEPGAGGRSLARAEQLQGKELSFNNLADLDGTLRATFEFDEPACVIVKHMNPCGVGLHSDGPSKAFELALSGDPVSAFGGILAFNRPLSGEDVRTIRQSRTFFEVLAAPGFDEEARELLAKRPNLRVMQLPADWATSRPAGQDARRVQGGWLLQDWDMGAPISWEIASQRAPTEAEAATLRFAWKVCRNVKSNAILLARAEDGGFVANGTGAGQMSRVDSVKLAISKATREVAGSVLASDAFFPFADGIEAAVEAGVTAIIQPGGSIRDEEVVAAADAAGVAMVMTGVRHFRH